MSAMLAHTGLYNNNERISLCEQHPRFLMTKIEKYAKSNYYFLITYNMKSFKVNNIIY